MPLNTNIYIPILTMYFAPQWRTWTWGSCWQRWADARKRSPCWNYVVRWTVRIPRTLWTTRPAGCRHWSRWANCTPTGAGTRTQCRLTSTRLPYCHRTTTLGWALLNNINYTFIVVTKKSNIGKNMKHKKSPVANILVLAYQYNIVTLKTTSCKTLCTTFR